MSRPRWLIVESRNQDRCLDKLRKAGLAPNTLQLLLKAFPDKPWSVDGLSSNHNIRIQNVLDHPDWAWNWVSLSGNMGISFQDILDHPSLPWDWTFVSINANVTIKDVLNNLDKAWNWRRLSANIGITVEEILAHLELSDESQDANSKRVCLPWDLSDVSNNPNVNISHVIAHPDWPWDWYFLSMNPGINFQDVMDYPDLPWYWQSLSSNLNIRIQDIIDYPDEAWSWYTLINNSPGIKVQDIIDHPELPWRWDKFRLEDKIWHEAKMDWRLFLTHPEKLKKWDKLSRLSYLTFEDIHDHINAPWDWNSMSYNRFESFHEVTQIYMDKYKIKSEDETFMNHLQVWRNHLDFKPEGEGAIQTVKDWKTKVIEITKEEN